MRLLFHQIHKNKHFECVPAAATAATTLLPTPVIDVCYHIDAVAVAIVVRIDVSRRCVLLCDIVCTQRVNTTNE